MSSTNRNNYDLDDDEADLKQWPHLRSLLVAFQKTLRPVYDTADQAAMRQQKRHGWLVWWAAICGTLAVLCAIFELSEILPFSGHVVGMIELISATVAIVVVGLGIWSALHPAWLLKRFLAEQCRFIKFHLLLNPAKWHGRSDEEVRALVERALQPLRKPEIHLMHEWLTWKCQLVDRFDAVPANLPDEVAKEVASYYEDKRLLEQQLYFDRQAKKRHRWERLTRGVSPWCFFLSIIAAFLHFAFEWRGGEDHHGFMHTAARISMLLAASLPVLAAGVRTIRAAHEFGRNQLRFEAMAHYLSVIQKDIARQSSSAAVISLLREAETGLDAEHRAWLRLMIEAEWFG